jgi:hypothetical protein
MVSRGDKRQSSSNRRRKAKVVNALIDNPADLCTKPAMKSSTKIVRGARHPSAVSTIFYDDQTGSFSQKAGKVKAARAITASVFINEPLDLTFTTKLRNVIHYIFEDLRDVVALSTPPSSDIEKSIMEMRALSGSAENRLNEELKRHLAELIEETEAFVRGEKTGLTGIPDFQSALHYRHYVRIAWLSHFILTNLPGPVPGRPSADFPPNS